MTVFTCMGSIDRSRSLTYLSFVDMLNQGLYPPIGTFTHQLFVVCFWEYIVFQGVLMVDQIDDGMGS